MATLVRPLEIDDQDALEPIDREAAGRYRLEPVVTRGSVAFYHRAGHAFVALRDGAPVGFVLAHAVWDGQRPKLMASRLALAAPGDRGAAEALLEALTKSAYDAAVYDLAVHHAEDDPVVASVLEDRGYHRMPEAIYGRVLGSRGGPAQEG